MGFPSGVFEAQLGNELLALLPPLPPFPPLPPLPLPLPLSFLGGLTCPSSSFGLFEGAMEATEPTASGVVKLRSFTSVSFMACSKQVLKLPNPSKMSLYAFLRTASS